MTTSDPSPYRMLCLSTGELVRAVDGSPEGWPGMEEAQGWVDSRGLPRNDFMLFCKSFQR